MCWETNRGFFRGFVYATRGVLRCVKEERNFRFHLTFAAYVVGFATQFSLSRVEWLVLCLCIGAMLSAELINSAIERTVDRISTEQHPLSGAAKDVAAASVLILAVAVTVIGVLLFWRPTEWADLITRWVHDIWQPCVLAVSFLPAFFFVFRR